MVAAGTPAEVVFPEAGVDSTEAERVVKDPVATSVVRDEAVALLEAVVVPRSAMPERFNMCCREPNGQRYGLLPRVANRELIVWQRE